jgi:aldose 1-epimerase
MASVARRAGGPSGTQIPLRRGDQELTLVEVGGGIREYRRGGRAVLDGYRLDEMCPAGHGQPLIPWPNRIGAGHYRFDGRDEQLPITEVARGNAIHGLLCWAPWTVVDRGEDRAVLGARVHPQPGYPFDLGVEIEYALGDSGLTVTVRATNLGGDELPFGAGQHPYFAAGSDDVSGLRLTLPAGAVLEMNDRMVPVGRAPVAGQLDFRSGRAIGETVLDHCFADLDRDAGGRATVELQRADGMLVRVWMDERWGWTQAFTGDALGAPRARRAVAIEPMTCPPNAFQTGDGLITLAPGARFTGSWGVDATAS